jgi:hypothetical protein
MAKTNFTQRVGTTSGADAGMKSRDRARATLRTTFRSRFELRVPRSFFDLRFVAKSSADYAECGEFGKAKFAFLGSIPQPREPAVSGSLPETCKKALSADYAKHLGKLPR